MQKIKNAVLSCVHFENTNIRRRVVLINKLNISIHIIKNTKFNKKKTVF